MQTSLKMLLSAELQWKWYDACTTTGRRRKKGLEEQNYKYKITAINNANH